MWTTLECRPSPRSVTDGPGRLAHSYGSEGWGFESLRARPAQRPVAILRPARQGPKCSNVADRKAPARANVTHQLAGERHASPGTARKNGPRLTIWQPSRVRYAA